MLYFLLKGQKLIRFATYWPRAGLTDSFENGKLVNRELVFSDTPEEFVAKLRAQDARIYVAKGSCVECFYHPDSPFPKAELQKAEQEHLLSYHRILECIRNTVARRQGRYDTPDMIVCYGYYYQHVHENKYLLAAKEAGLIVFCDVSEMESLKESGLLITRPGFVL